VHAAQGPTATRRLAHGAVNRREEIARIKQIVRTWIKNGVLKTVEREDNNSKKRMFVVPGLWTEIPIPKRSLCNENDSAAAPRNSRKGMKHERAEMVLLRPPRCRERWKRVPGRWMSTLGIPPVPAWTVVWFFDLQDWCRGRR
jgi:hypothetical protein